MPRKVKKSPLAKQLTRIWERQGVREPHHIARYMTPERMLQLGGLSAEQRAEIDELIAKAPGQVFPGGRGKKWPEPKRFKIDWPK